MNLSEALQSGRRIRNRTLDPRSIVYNFYQPSQKNIWSDEGVRSNAWEVEEFVVEGWINLYWNDEEQEATAGNLWPTKEEATRSSQNGSIAVVFVTSRKEGK